MLKRWNFLKTGFYEGINLIPAQYVKIPIFSRNSTLALIAVVELIFAIILFQTYGDQSLKTLGFREIAPVIVPERPLAAQIRQTKTQRNGLVNAHSSITGQSINWPKLLDLIFNGAPDRIKSISFQQTGQQLTLSGTAGAHANVFEYESS